MRRRGRGGGHVRSRGVVAKLISSVLHLYHLSFWSDEAVASGHQHGVGSWVTNLLSGTAVIIGKTEEDNNKFYEVKDDEDELT